MFNNAGLQPVVCLGPDIRDLRGYTSLSHAVSTSLYHARSQAPSLYLALTSLYHTYSLYLIISLFVFLSLSRSPSRSLCIVCNALCRKLSLSLSLTLIHSRQRERPRHTLSNYRLGDQRQAVLVRVPGAGPYGGSPMRDFPWGSIHGRAPMGEHPWVNQVN